MQINNYEEKVAVLKRVKRYIDEHLDGSVTGRDVAEYFGYTYMTFRKFVQEYGGFSIHSYIRLRRIQKAAQCLRNGMTTTNAAKEVGFETLSGFNKAFFDTYGVTSSEFARTRGRCLMTEPLLVERDPCYVVGYVFNAGSSVKFEELGGYWIGQDFPDVSEGEFGKIGGGVESVAIWVEWEGNWYYLMGPPVERADYVPKKMLKHYIPGGQFLEFKVPPSSNNTVLCDSIRAVWWYAYKQWLPESEYEADPSRLAVEFYFFDDNRLYVPVKRRLPPYGEP